MSGPPLMRGAPSVIVKPFAVRHEDLDRKWRSRIVYATDPKGALVKTRENVAPMARRVEVDTGRRNPEGAPVLLRWARYPLDFDWVSEAETDVTWTVEEESS